MISDRCYHVPTSPGQSMCTCLDELMWMRQLCELQARRITQLEVTVQHHHPHLIEFRHASEPAAHKPGQSASS